MDIVFCVTKITVLLTISEAAVPCPGGPDEYRFDIMELQDPLTSPIRLRLKVPDVNIVIVYFSPLKPGKKEASYDVCK